MPVGGSSQAMERLGIIMKFLDAEFVQGFIRMADDGWQQGWHERNGGNLSYRVKPEEVELVKENFEPKEFQPIGTTVPALAGEYFLVTGSGKYFRNVSMFAAGFDFDLTFGLMHTVEKSAEILVKMLSMQPNKRQTITPDDFRHLAKDFGVTLPEEFLYEK